MRITLLLLPPWLNASPSPSFNASPSLSFLLPQPPTLCSKPPLLNASCVRSGGEGAKRSPNKQTKPFP